MTVCVQIDMENKNIRKEDINYSASSVETKLHRLQKTDN